MPTPLPVFLFCFHLSSFLQKRDFQVSPSCLRSAGRKACRRASHSQDTRLGARAPARKRSKVQLYKHDEHISF
jgi:hypothetical protein